MRYWVVICVVFFCFSTDCHSYHPKFSTSDAPSWMKNQVTEDLKPFKNKKISLKKMNKLFQRRVDEWLLVKFTIDDGKVLFKTNIAKNHFIYHRIESYYKNIVMLANQFGLPDMQFLICMADGVELPENAFEGIPVFAMCRSVGQKCILIPDFDILNQGYQVLQGSDVTTVELPWENKTPMMIWRGSTAQNHTLITNNNLEQFSRVKLCELSNEQPHLIDAKFTIFAQLGESIPYLEQFRDEGLSYESQFGYKYHMLIDGNASSYSASGWKLFTNSVIFKPDSRWVQWYYGLLQPWTHYIPVNIDLTDLVEKIGWAIENDSVAKEIARNCRTLALSHITHPSNLDYLHLSLLKYSKLKFK